MSFDLEKIRILNTLTYDEAFDVSCDMIKNSKMKEPKKARLRNSLVAVSTSKKIEEIMWYAYLSGEGLASVDSRWNK